MSALRYAPARRRAIVARVNDLIDSGLPFFRACRRLGVGAPSVTKWAKAFGVHLQKLNRGGPGQSRRCRESVTGKPYVMSPTAFRCHGSLMALVASIGAQAVRDVQDGLEVGALNASTWEPTGKGLSHYECGVMPSRKESEDAARWLHSEEAEMLCALITALAGRELMTPARMQRLAALPPRHQCRNDVFWLLASQEERDHATATRRAFRQRLP